MASTFTAPLAVIDAVEDAYVVWHVDIGQDRALSRLSGAWVIDREDAETLRDLVDGHPWTFCHGNVALPEGITSPLLVDTAATARAVRAEIAAADARFTEQVTTKPGLIRPDWPSVEEVEETGAPVATDERARAALALAHGMAELATAWQSFESLRTARDYLIPLGGESARPLPLTPGV
ncbi:hypothetical protein ACWEKT_15045 [Nocardia takedensis]